MITFNQAENLFRFAKMNQYTTIYAELDRVGLNNLMNLMGPDQQRRLIHFMAGNKPAEALKLLSNYPSEEVEILEDDHDSWCCGLEPDEAGLCPVCKEHIN